MFCRRLQNHVRTRCPSVLLSRTRTAVRSLSASVTDEPERNHRAVAHSLSATCLGLEASLVTPYVDSIGQLPEVASVLENPWIVPKEAVESLRRASDIFASFQPGGHEHTAVLALLAETLQRRGDFGAATKTLDQILKYVTEKDTRIDATLAMAKTRWMQGQFVECRNLADKILQEDDSLPEELPLHALGLESCKALATLFLEGPTTAREMSQTTAEKYAGRGITPLPWVALHLNLGVMEALHGNSIDCEGDNTCSTRYIFAKAIWQEGLDILETAPEKDSSGLAHLLKGRLHSNLAWTCLQIGGRNESLVSEASESARLALKSLEHESLHGQEGLTRALTLVAQCYHRAQHAVTAEGLFQSALDYGAISPQQVLERAAAYQAYAELCKDWEKRQGDSDKLMAKSRSTLDKLPGGWKGTTDIYSSLWFWTPGIFRELGHQ